jgi:hypothetical protein
MTLIFYRLRLLNFHDLKGNIDSDVLNDYIITYGEKPGNTILFLSSQEEDGDVLKDMTCFYNTYCC